jgi:ATP-dependent Lon protease
MFFKSDDKGGEAKAKGGAPLLPLRDIIVFPHTVQQLFVGRERSIAALDEAMSRGKEIFLSTQRNAKTNEPVPEDIFEVGTLGVIMQLLRLPDGTVKVLVEGKKRARISAFSHVEPYFFVEYDEIVETTPDKAERVELEAHMRTAQTTFEAYAKLNKKIQPEVLMSIQVIDEPGRLADTIAANLPSIKLADRQGLLELADGRARLERLVELMQAEVEILQVEKKIRSRVKKQMEKTQKEYYLNEQMQAIQKELGGGERDEFKNEIQEIEELLKTKKMSKEAVSKVKKELKKLKMMHPTSAEATVVRNYIDWILELPWYDTTEENFDLGAAETVLDEDHYGLQKIKERILEYLAVQALTKQAEGAGALLRGPARRGQDEPRQEHRARDGAQVRAALARRRARRGRDPWASAHLHRRAAGQAHAEPAQGGHQQPGVLARRGRQDVERFPRRPRGGAARGARPRAERTFNDHYLDLDYDLSDVMFITTANSLSGIPVPLQDRMEIIQLSGYTEFEKLNIAVKYLVPRQRKECGLDEVPLTISEGALRTVIHHYTKESGVRGLEREIASVCRKVARQVVAEGKDKPIEISAKQVPKFLGVPKYRVGKAEERDEVGLVNGLAVTSVGGDLLPTEAVVLPGKGKLVITGLLEKGMEESAQAAMSYVRSRIERFGKDSELVQKLDVHVHFPDFVRKDGPSAGITMVTAILSAILRAPVRRDLAMTGEITLRGRVLPIGGLKEKLLAAHRGGIGTVLIPKENRKDLRDVPRRVLRSLRIVLVEHADEVIREALVYPELDTALGGVRASMEYRAGELYVDGQPAAPPVLVEPDEPRHMDA